MGFIGRFDKGPGVESISYKLPQPHRWEDKNAGELGHRLGAGARDRRGEGVGCMVRETDASGGDGGAEEIEDEEDEEEHANDIHTEFHCSSWAVTSRATLAERLASNERAAPVVIDCELVQPTRVDLDLSALDSASKSGAAHVESDKPTRISSPAED